MKLGLVRRGYSATGGAETYLRRFADCARAAGHECVLFATGEWPARSWNGEIVRVEGTSPRGFADALEALEPHRHCDVLFSLERVWTCDVYRAGDGVHAAWLQRRAPYGPWWQRLARRFNRRHRDVLEIEQHLLGGGGTDRVIANSHLVKAEIEEHFGFPGEQIHVIHNGVPHADAVPGARAAVRRELGLSDSEYVILFVGSGWERKGLRYAVKAMNAARLRDATLLVAGRGNRGSIPRSKQVRYLGPREDVPLLLAASDLFVLPTIYDPFSNACLEAAAAAKPVVTTRHNGFAEIMEPGVHGEVLAEPSDVEALARAITEWAPRERRAEAALGLRELGARFSVEENVRQSLAILSEAAAGRSAR